MNKQIITLISCSLIFLTISLTWCLYMLDYEANKLVVDIDNTKITTENIFIETHDEINDLFYMKINGINVYSDITNFTEYRNLLNNLSVTQEKYPSLNYIVFYENNYLCNGYYRPYYDSITIFNCDKFVYTRGKKIDKGFILLHELGHYYIDHNNNLDYISKYENYLIEEYWADDFARKKINELNMVYV